MRRRPIMRVRGKRSIEQELVVRRSDFTSTPYNQHRSISQSASQSWSETQCGLHHSECSCIAKHIEAKRSMVSMVITPLPLFPFPFSFPVESRGWLLSSLHSSSHSSATNNTWKRSKRAKESVKMGRLFCLLRISFFSGMGRHNNVINAAFPFPVFFFRVGKLMMHG